MSTSGQGNELGRRIRAARERKGWTQQELGAAVGVGLRTVGNWERGASVPRNRLGKLVEVLGPGIDPDADVQVSAGSDPSAEVRLMFAHYGELSQLDLLRLSRLVMDEAVRRGEQG